MENKPLNEIMNGGELYHHGVLGMKWGVRRYQPYSLIPRKSGKGGKETGDAKKTSKSSSSSKVSSKAKSAKVSVVKKTRKQKSAEAKARVESEAKTARQRKEQLDKIVNSGDAKLVYEHRHELTKKQLDEAIDRINTEVKVSALVKAQAPPSKFDKVKQLAGKAEDVNSIAKSGLSIYKTAKEIRGLYDEAQKAESAKEKAEISSKAVKDIIDTGKYSSDAIKSLQSVLTEEDLATLTKRATNLATLDKNDKEIIKRARADVKDREDFKSYLTDRDAHRLDYLRTSISDIEKGKKAAAEWGEDIKPSRYGKDPFTGEPRKPKNKRRSAREVLKDDAKLFDATGENKLFDEYFEDEVKRRNNGR